MDRKKHTFILQIFYQKIYNRPIDGISAQGLDIDTMIYTHTDDEKVKAFNAARNQMNKVIKDGFAARIGGSIWANKILPTSIKQVAILNLDDYEREESDRKADQAGSSTAPAGSDSELG